MRPRFSLLLSLISLILLLGASSTDLFAKDTTERTQVGHNITVGPDEEVSEVTCFGCSVRIRGHVDGDVTTFGGSVLLEDNADVSGDVTTFGGSARLDGAVNVGGDLTTFGGRIHRDPAAKIGGDVSNFGGGFWVVLIFGLPLIVLGGCIALMVWLIRIIMRPRVPATA